MYVFIGQAIAYYAYGVSGMIGCVLKGSSVQMDLVPEVWIFVFGVFVSCVSY